MEQSRGIGRKNMILLILFGLGGQIAWCIENSFLNLYVYRTITTDLRIVSAMVASSAIVATLTAIIMGWVTDRLGKRRPFMCYGYILWGISVMIFAMFSVKNMQSLLGADHSKAIIYASIGMVVMDCVMTFFGSTANDSCFNAWVNDITDKGNRGRIEALLSVLSMAAYLLVFLPFEATGITATKYYDAAGNQVTTPVDGGSAVSGNWTLFYCALGALMIGIGIIGIFTLRDSPDLRPKLDLPFKELFYGFRPTVVKRNKYLYLVLATLAISGIANNCFSNYLIIYLQNTLKCDDYIPALGYLLPMALIYGLSAVAGIVVGIMLDKKQRKTTFLLPGILASSIGSLLMFFFSPRFMQIGVPTLALFCVASLIQATGSSMIIIICTATIRNLIPEGKVGRFLGIRMIFYVAVPMAIGSVASAFISNSSQYITGYDEFGHAIYTCPPVMFLLASIVVLSAIFTAIPLLRAKGDALTTPAESDETLVSIPESPQVE